MSAECGNSNRMKQNICTTSYYYSIWQLDLSFVFVRLLFECKYTIQQYRYVSVSVYVVCMHSIKAGIVCFCCYNCYIYTLLRHRLCKPIVHKPVSNDISLSVRVNVDVDDRVTHVVSESPTASPRPAPTCSIANLIEICGISSQQLSCWSKTNTTTMSAILTMHALGPNKTGYNLLSLKNTTEAGYVHKFPSVKISLPAFWRWKPMCLIVDSREFR